MLKSGILNPHVLSLVARIRHTNRLVVADWAFPFWPGIETVDLSLITGVPTVTQVLSALLPHWKCEAAYMAEEFKSHHSDPTDPTLAAFAAAFQEVPVHFEPHVALKARVPGAIGLIRTGDATVYSNVVLVSG